MVDPFDAACVQEPNNMVSDPSSHSEDTDSTSSSNREGNCEEHCRPRKNKKRRRKISHIIKYVIGFSFMKKLKTNKKSQKQRSNTNDDDKPPPPPATTTTIHNPNSHHSSYQYCLDDSKPNAANESPYRSLKASPLMQCNSSSSSPFPSYNSTTSSTLENHEDNVEPDEELAVATSSTKRLFGFVGMHHVMLIISLAALVLSGKACAIFCTIVWLVLIPLTSQFSNGRRRRSWAHLGRDNERALIVRKFMARF